MKTLHPPLLIFPPIASPTYIPLGVSILKAYVDSIHGPGSLDVRDANLHYWEILTDAEEPAREYRSFMRGERGTFSEEFYGVQLPARRGMGAANRCVLDDVRRYLDSGRLSSGTSSLFAALRQACGIDGESVVLLSCMFPDQLLFTLGWSRWIAAEIPGVRMIIGGASATVVRPADLLRNAGWIDALFTGEGEAGVASLVDGVPYAGIPGLAYRDGGRIAVNRKPDSLSPASCPGPDFGWASIESYFNPVPVLPVMASRGCKWRRCRFCAHNLATGSYRAVPPVRMAEELVTLRDTMGAAHFYFVDQYLDAGYLVPLARELIARNSGISYTFMGRPSEDMTAEVLELLAASGCSWISWGVETGSRRLLDIAAKGTRVETVASVLKASSSAGIRNLAMMIFGLPGSTDEDLDATFSFLEDTRPYIDTLTESEFILYRDTPFGRQPDRFGLSVGEASEFCRIGGRPVPSGQSAYTMLDATGNLRLPRGPEEGDRWAKRRPWIYPHTLWDELPAEHYLLLASRLRESTKPVRPVSPGNRPAA